MYKRQPLKVTGKLQYTDDLTLPRMVYAKILRSPHAHAIIKNIDFSKALELDGVLDVLQGSDFPIDYGIVAHSANEQVLARDKVRMWGEPVAAVCAMTEEIAERALELIDVEYELLPVVVDGRDAERMANEEGVLIHEDKPGNIAHQGKQQYLSLIHIFRLFVTEGRISFLWPNPLSGNTMLNQGGR